MDDDVPDVIREGGTTLPNTFSFIGVPISLNLDFEGIDLSRDDRFAKQINSFLGGITDSLIEPSLFAYYLNFRYENGTGGLSISKSVIIEERCYDLEQQKSGLVCEFNYAGKKNVLIIDETGIQEYFCYEFQIDDDSIQVHGFRDQEEYWNNRVQFLVSYLSRVYQEALISRENRSRG